MNGQAIHLEGKAQLESRLFRWQKDKRRVPLQPHERRFVFLAGERLAAGVDIFYEVTEPGLEIAPRRLNPEDELPWWLE